MDDRSFDRLARLLGEATDRRTGLKALVGGILGAGGLAALDADADAKRKDKSKGRNDGPGAGKKKKRKKCNPACDAGFACVKGRCICASGVSCAGACCGAGQLCRDGACGDPLPTCLEFGAECKGTGRRCCDGLTCASGQDGSFPVTCLRSKGAACAGTEECPFGMSCTDGVCRGNGGGVPTGASCAGGASCEQPGAVCTSYTTAGAPGGEFCTLPLRKVCTGNPDCSCYNCWYVQPGVVVNGRVSRADAPQKACIQPKNAGCTTTDDCALGLTCQNNVCTASGDQCAPGGAPCGGAVSCCQGSTCQNGTCSGGGGGGGSLGGACTTVADCPSVTGVACVAYASAVPGATADTYCLLPDGESATSRTHCVGKALDLDGKCRTCTVYHGAYTGTSADADALAALKTAIETGTANPVYVGTGLYKPASGTNNTTLITASRGTTAAPLRILACLDADGRPVIDGGADVKNGSNAPVTTDNANDLTWTGGNRIMEIAAGTSAAEKAVEIAGIDFQHGNATANYAGGGALYVRDYASLNLKSSTIARCRAKYNGGGISVYFEYGYVKGGSATLRGVTITQCTSVNGGAINHSGLALKIEGSSTEKTTLTNNYATYGGAIATDGNNATLGSTTQLAWVAMTGNIASSEGGGIYCSEQEKNGIDLADVLIDGNKAIDAVNGSGSGGGISLQSCGSGWVQGTYSKNSFVRVDITNNQAMDGPGGLYINQDPSYAPAPLDFVDSNVTGNKALNLEADSFNVNGAYSQYGGAGTVTCSRTSGTQKTFRDNNGVDCTYDTYYSDPWASACCAATTPCQGPICDGTCCAISPSSCNGTGAGPFTCQ